MQRQESSAQAQALRPPSPLPTSDGASLDAGSAAMAAGPEQRRINVHARGGGGGGSGSRAETTGLEASWMHYSSAHRQWWPRGGPRAAEKELHPPPLPLPRPRPGHPPPPSPSPVPVLTGGLYRVLRVRNSPKAISCRLQTLHSLPSHPRVANSPWLKPEVVHFRQQTCLVQILHSKHTQKFVSSRSHKLVRSGGGREETSRSSGRR